MKRIAVFLPLLLPVSLLATELGKPDLAGPEFTQRFTASYGFLSAREPQITDLELAVLEKLAPLVANNPANAQSALESLLADGKPVSAAFNHVLGNLYFTAGELSRAEEQYAQAIRKFPDFQRAWNSLGTLHMERDAYDEAARALGRSVELGANDAQTYGMLGYALLRTRSYAAAEVAYNLALLRDPDSVRWLEGKVRILSEVGRHEETLAASDELLRNDPQNFEYWRLQANAHLALGHNLETARSLEIARNFGHLDASALFLLGNIYLKEDMADHALDAYLAAIDLAPRSNTGPSTLLKVAHSLLGQERFDLAQRLVATLQTDTGTWTSAEKVQYQMLVARIALHDGKSAEAVTAFEQALDLDPTNAECLYRLAIVHAENGRGEKARYFLERIRDDANYEYGAHLYLARMLVGERRFTDALTSLRTAYRLKPSTEVEALYNRVRVAAESDG